MTEERFAQMVATCPEIEVVEQGTFGNEHLGQPDFRWLYASKEAVAWVIMLWAHG